MLQGIPRSSRLMDTVQHFRRSQQRLASGRGGGGGERQVKSREEQAEAAGRLCWPPQNHSCYWPAVTEEAMAQTQQENDSKGKGEMRIL